MINSSEITSKIYTLEEFVLHTEIDNYNLRPLIDFCVQSKLAQKLHGFSEKFSSISNLNTNVSDKKHGLQNFLNQISKSNKKTEKGKSKTPIVEDNTETVEKVQNY